ncbi:MAG: hypothetical protein ORO03_03655, partial [Alphaproteobacteria bacterium]|nr:hypothetical protein [Alphaproteobacteria bacterium]
MNFFKPLTGKNDTHNHDQMQECMVVLKEVATAAKSGEELRALDSLKHLMTMVNRSELPTTIRERFIEEGKKYTLAVHRLKLQDYFDRAFNYTRSGDTANRELMIRNSLKCIEAMGHLTTNSQFIEEMLKRVDVLRQTSQAGTSD